MENLIQMEPKSRTRIQSKRNVIITSFTISKNIDVRWIHTLLKKKQQKIEERKHDKTICRYSKVFK